MSLPSGPPQRARSGSRSPRLHLRPRPSRRRYVAARTSRAAPQAVIPGPSRRVLILSASMGAGHDGAARELSARLVAAGHTVETYDWLRLMPLRLGLFIRWFYGMQLDVAPESYAWIHRHSQRRGWFMTVSTTFANLSKRRVRRLVLASEADVVVSTYPLASQVLGSLRAQGRSHTPTVTFMTDFDVHALWVHTHIDLHLAVSEPTARLAESLVGRPALATGPMVPARFTEAARDRVSRRSRLRRELGIGADEVVALTVAGSWGVGDVGLTVRRLTDGGRVTALVICGRNEELRTTLAAMPGVVALGWRTDMHDLMVAADVLVENAGGLTAMEAFAAGLPVISHECIPGHGPANAGAMASMGVSTWAEHPAELVPAVLRLARRGAAVSTPQSARALEVFLADPSALVASLAVTGQLAAAVRAAGLRVPAALTPARPSLVLQWRRRAKVAGAGAAAAFVLAGSGVAAATSMGVGVADGQGDHPHSVYLAVRLGQQDLTDGSLTPALLTALTRDHAVVAADDSLLRGDPALLTALAAAHIPVVNGGTGARERTSLLADPRQSRADLVSSRKTLAGRSDAAPWVFLSCRHLSAFDLGTSFVKDEVLVHPNVVVRGREKYDGRGGVIVLLDGHTMSATQLNAGLADVATRSTASGVTMASLLTILKRPR